MGELDKGRPSTTTAESFLYLQRSVNPKIARHLCEDLVAAQSEGMQSGSSVFENLSCSGTPRGISLTRRARADSLLHSVSAMVFGLIQCHVCLAQ